MAADPLDNPGIWERPTLDGQPIPGTRVVCTSGGERALKVEQAQQVGFAGAFTAVRGEEMPTLTYRIECADKAARQEVVPWLQVMRIGQSRKAQGITGSIFKPAVYRFFDPHVEHNGIVNVLCARIGRWYRPNERSNLWAVDVVFAEWKKPVKIGGVVAPRAKDEADKAIKDAEAARDAAQKEFLRAQAESMKKDPGAFFKFFGL